MNHFDDDDAFSRSRADAPYWEALYRAYFPTLDVLHSQRDDGWAQRAGIDRRVILRDGTVHLVDEKVRRRDYGDILLEVWSDTARRKPGWLLKESTCDFIAYAVEPAQTCYLFPFPLLRRAYKQNKFRWADDPERYRVVKAQNPGYVTTSVAVPVAELLDTVRDASIARWELPPAGEPGSVIARTEQLAFPLEPTA